MNEALAKMRDITITEFEMLHTSTPPDFGGNPGKNGNNIVSNFKKRLRAENFQRPDPMELEFDLIGVDPSLANALRRIMISEVPSMAIEKVFIYNNTSIIQDEVLAHRLGLIPLKADPRFFDWKPAKPSSGAARLDDEEMVKEAEGTPNDTAVYELKIRCKNNPDAPTGSESSKDLFIDTNVYSSSIKPMAKPGQPNDLGPVQDDILIAKLRPGHEIDLKLYAVKGLGRDHAKFSPVCTTFYRLLPKIEIVKPVIGEAALRLQSCFSPGVIGIETDQKTKTPKAVVLDARHDACSRNIFRHEDLQDCLVMSKVRDHFIFKIESAGAVPPADLFAQAIDVLVDKCDTFLKELEATCD